MTHFSPHSPVCDTAPSAQSTADNRLYPNPAAGIIHENPTGMFEFLGRILGKAIYEGILLELPLAGFFLKKFQSLRMNDINDLPSLDPELYKQLMFLRSYEVSSYHADHAPGPSV